MNLDTKQMQSHDHVNFCNAQQTSVFVDLKYE